MRPAFSDYHLISWRNSATSSKCGISSLIHQSQMPAIFVIFQLPSLFSVKIKCLLCVTGERCQMLCPKWSSEELEMEIPCAWTHYKEVPDEDLLAITGLWFQVRLWTHAAKSWMAPRPPLETWGQGAATSIQPPDLPSWPLEHLMSPLYLGHQGSDTQQSCICYRCHLQRDR